MQRVEIPVGQQMQVLCTHRKLRVLLPQSSPGVSDIRAEIERAVDAPIGTPPLRMLACGKRTAAIVVNDITRPYPGRVMVEVIAQRLNEVGITDDRICLVMAYGHHRDNTPQELTGMFGESIMRRFTIVHHHATDPQTLCTLGTTSMSIPVEINRRFAEAELKITTGCITPHQLAGFSGGRKSILPGISGMNALKQHHSFPIRPDRTSLGWLEGNPFHEQAVEAARIAGVDFIVNSIDNAEHGVVHCVAGDLEKAYLHGVMLCRKVWTVEAPAKAKIVIVSPGGYPRDFDLHQSQKALGCAETLCQEGGRIILCAQMRDGGGRPGEVLKKAESPDEIIETFRQTGYTPQALSKAYMLARALKKYHISVACSRIAQDELRQMFMDGFDTVQQALDAAIAEQGENADILVVPYASDILPAISWQQRNG